MSLSRRKFLAIAGGGIVLAASAGAGLFLGTRTPTEAVRPWYIAGGYEDPRKRALSFALLAPNPHNQQPWLVNLDAPDTVGLYVDTNRLLPETDPFSRQITIGLGCFLELMAMAAAQDGYDVETTLFPQGFDDTQLDARPIAVTRFSKSLTVKPDPLFAYTLARRSVKEPYDMARPVSDEELGTVAGAGALAGAVTSAGTIETAEVEALRELTWQAWRVEYETPAKLQESIDVMRLGKAEIEANPDGIDLGGPFLESLMLAGLLDREQIADPSTQAWQTGFDMYRKMCFATPAYVWLTTAGNSRPDQFAAGRAWLRLNLAATSLGMGVQPMSQALQEYPEMTALYDDVHAKLASSGETIQMLGRLGHTSPVPPSPRWPLEAKIV